MEIQVYPSNAALPEHLRGQILALIRIAFHDTAGDYRGPEALPEEWHPMHVVGVEGDVILNYAGVVWQEIRHAGETFKTYGLSSVYTFPHYRGAGRGSRIVRRATGTSRCCSPMTPWRPSMRAVAGRRCRGCGFWSAIRQSRRRTRISR